MGLGISDPAVSVKGYALVRRPVVNDYFCRRIEDSKTLKWAEKWSGCLKVTSFDGDKPPEWMTDACAALNNGSLSEAAFLKGRYRGS